MHIPEILYQLPLAKDRATQQIEHVIRIGQTTGGSNSRVVIPVFYVVPKDRWLCVTQAGFQGVPDSGASQIFRAAFLTIIDRTELEPNLFTHIAQLIPQPQIAGSPLQMSATAVNTWVPPGFSVEGTVFTSSDSAIAVVALSFSGFTIPRGNLTRG